ncbi:C39 family peptidase [Sporolactobacillus laevolacticus]|uniref:G5 domain-containing protein n=1 Tax=Sporolactobacillus laevolacticus DSM 442 TaxID=1395513 RepID=V6IXQ5_9BACL|nr:C39 family peptidase [Sporolactobacillus laevolacticus]EST12168.1 hypothetical protein P343_08880 [Sporolactobacillus laevolacticus DSM 442]
MNKRFIRHSAILIILILSFILSGCSIVDSFSGRVVIGEAENKNGVTINIQQVPSVIRLGTDFDPRKNVKVIDQQKRKISVDQVKISGHVNTKQTGTYKLIYTYQAHGVSVSKSKTIQVVYKKQIPIPYETKTVEEKTIERGKTIVRQKGMNGSRLVSYDAKFVNGKVITLKELTSRNLKDPIVQVVYSGTKIPKSYRMNVAAISQLPNLPAGCEITAVTMMLRYHGANVTKEQMAEEMPRATNGDPNTGFVGSPYSKSGVTIYPPALMQLVKKYAGSSVNLTGVSTDQLKNYLSKNHPVVIWGTFDRFLYHALTLTGYTPSGFYYNDPWTGTKRRMENTQMIAHWNALDRRAITD